MKEKNKQLDEMMLIISIYATICDIDLQSFINSHDLITKQKLRLRIIVNINKMIELLKVSTNRFEKEALAYGINRYNLTDEEYLKELKEYAKDKNNWLYTLFLKKGITFTKDTAFYYQQKMETKEYRYNLKQQIKTIIHNEHGDIEFYDLQFTALPNLINLLKDNSSSIEFYEFIDSYINFFKSAEKNKNMGMISYAINGYRKKSLFINYDNIFNYINHNFHILIKTGLNNDDGKLFFNLWQSCQLLSICLEYGLDIKGKINKTINPKDIFKLFLDTSELNDLKLNFNRALEIISMLKLEINIELYEWIKTILYLKTIEPLVEWNAQIQQYLVILHSYINQGDNKLLGLRK